MQNLIITDKGKELIAGLVAGSLTARFTKIQTTDYNYSGMDLEKLTSIYAPKQTAAVSKVTRTDVNIVEVTAAIDNKDLTDGYYVRAVGLFAQTSRNVEILYGIAVETQNPDYMPAFGGKSSTGITYRFSTKVDNSENITVEVNPAATPTVQQVEDAQNAANNALAAAEEAQAAAEKALAAAGGNDPIPFTLPVEAWSALEAPRGKCTQFAEIEIEGFTEAGIADVIFSLDCFDTLAAAKVPQGGDPGDGKIVVYAETVPEEEITGVVVVYKKGGD